MNNYFYVAYNNYETVSGIVSVDDSKYQGLALFVEIKASIENQTSKRFNSNGSFSVSIINKL